MNLEYRNLNEDGSLAAWVLELKGKSGVYFIKERGIFGGLLYVGESHTGRLKKTLLRHFQKWKGPTSGFTFRPEDVEIAIVRTKPEHAVALKNAAIAEFLPKLNDAGKPKPFWEKLLVWDSWPK